MEEECEGTLSLMARALADERRAQARQLALAARFADEHAHLLESDGPVMPGTERLVRSGSDGTHAIAEFASLELSLAMGVSAEEAGVLIHDAVDMRDRMPKLWQRVQDCEVLAWQARKVVSACYEVTLDDARALDERFAARVGTGPLSRLLRAVNGAVLKALGQEKKAGRAKAREERGLWVRQDAFGVAQIYGTLDANDAFWLDAQLNRMATALGERGDADTFQQRRATALGMLASPLRAAELLGEDLPDGVQPEDLLPRAELVVHITDETLRTRDGVARAEGLQPLLHDWAAEMLQGAKVRIRPVIDIDGMAPVDAYEIPHAMREAVCQRNPYSAFPFSRRRSQGLDLDHTEAFRFDGTPGQTRVDNLGPLSRREHRAKTHGGWNVEQIQSGVFLWRSPSGIVALTTPSGSWTLHIPSNA